MEKREGEAQSISVNTPLNGQNRCALTGSPVVIGFSIPKIMTRASIRVVILTGSLGLHKTLPVL